MRGLYLTLCFTDLREQGYAEMERVSAMYFGYDVSFLA